MWRISILSVGLIISLSFEDTFQLQGFNDRDSVLAVTGKAKEYCLTTENFEARCLKNEVIIMNSATYGRMRICRCLDAKDLSSFGSGPDILGCSVDVLHILDNRCSLKNQCEIMLTLDADLLKETPCHPSLKSYLEADFDCVTVIEADRSCTVSVSSSPLHLMHSSTTKHSCGTKHQPWIIEAPLGQNINVSLLDLNSQVQTSANQQTGNCRQYGYIIDRSSKKNISICGFVHERRKIIYKSSSNVIELVLNSSINMGLKIDTLKFLFGFTAIGCSNLVPPEDTWLRRKDNEEVVVIGCYSSYQTWTLHCVDQQWSGVIGNCTRAVPVFSEMFETAVNENSIINYQVIVIVTIGVLGLIICVIIVIVGAVCLKRYTVVREYKYRQQIEKNSTNAPNQNINHLTNLMT